MDDTESFISLYGRFGNHRQAFVDTLNCYDGNANAVLDASDTALKQAGLKASLVQRIRQENSRWTDECLSWLEQPGHHLLRFYDKSYPALLREIPDFPPLLFAKGNLDLLRLPQIAIVGSRRCTAGGAKTAEQFAASLAEIGIAVTSGLAQGIDGAAHRGALNQQGATIAVLGTGPDRVYPSCHQKLAVTIADQGLLVSEFAPGTAAAKHHFPRRNRIISGLSLATLVVEASLRSGSLITARLAAEQGRDVFALPGSIHNPQARGCHRLLREGAILVENIEQIIEELNSMLDYLGKTCGVSKKPAPSVNADEATLLKHLAYDPVTIDELSDRSGLTIDKLSSILLALELKQLIAPAPGGRIVRI